MRDKTVLVVASERSVVAVVVVVATATSTVTTAVGLDNAWSVGAEVVTRDVSLYRLLLH